MSVAVAAKRWGGAMSVSDFDLSSPEYWRSTESDAANADNFSSGTPASKDTDSSSVASQSSNSFLSAANMFKEPLFGSDNSGSSNSGGDSIGLAPLPSFAIPDGSAPQSKIFSDFSGSTALSSASFGSAALAEPVLPQLPADSLDFSGAGASGASAPVKQGVVLSDMTGRPVETSGGIFGDELQPRTGVSPTSETDLALHKDALGRLQYDKGDKPTGNSTYVGKSANGEAILKMKDGKTVNVPAFDSNTAEDIKQWAQANVKGGTSAGAATKLPGQVNANNVFDGMQVTGNNSPIPKPVVTANKPDNTPSGIDVINNTLPKVAAKPTPPDRTAENALTGVANTINPAPVPVAKLDKSNPTVQAPAKVSAPRTVETTLGGQKYSAVPLDEKNYQVTTTSKDNITSTITVPSNRILSNADFQKDGAIVTALKNQENEQRIRESTASVAQAEAADRAANNKPGPIPNILKNDWRSTPAEIPKTGNPVIDAVTGVVNKGNKVAVNFSDGLKNGFANTVNLPGNIINSVVNSTTVRQPSDGTTKLDRLIQNPVESVSKAYNETAENLVGAAGQSIEKRGMVGAGAEFLGNLAGGAVFGTGNPTRGVTAPKTPPVPRTSTVASPDLPKLPPSSRPEAGGTGNFTMPDVPPLSNPGSSAPTSGFRSGAPGVNYADVTSQSQKLLPGGDPAVTLREWRAPTASNPPPSSPNTVRSGNGSYPNVVDPVQKLLPGSSSIDLPNTSTRTTSSSSTAGKSGIPASTPEVPTKVTARLADNSPRVPSTRVPSESLPVLDVEVLPSTFGTSAGNATRSAPLRTDVNGGNPIIAQAEITVDPVPVSTNGRSGTGPAAQPAPVRETAPGNGAAAPVMDRPVQIVPEIKIADQPGALAKSGNSAPLTPSTNISTANGGSTTGARPIAAPGGTTLPPASFTPNGSGKISLGPDLGRFNLNPNANGLFGNQGDWTGANFVSPNPGDFPAVPASVSFSSNLAVSPGELVYAPQNSTNNTDGQPASVPPPASTRIETVEKADDAGRAGGQRSLAEVQFDNRNRAELPRTAPGPINPALPTEQNNPYGRSVKPITPQVIRDTVSVPRTQAEIRNIVNAPQNAGTVRELLRKPENLWKLDGDTLRSILSESTNSPQLSPAEVKAVLDNPDIASQVRRPTTITETPNGPVIEAEYNKRAGKPASTIVVGPYSAIQSRYPQMNGSADGTEPSYPRQVGENNPYYAGNAIAKVGLPTYEASKEKDQDGRRIDPNPSIPFGQYPAPATPPTPGAQPPTMKEFYDLTKVMGKKFDGTDFSAIVLDASGKPIGGANITAQTAVYGQPAFDFNSGEVTYSDVGVKPVYYLGQVAGFGDGAGTDATKEILRLPEAVNSDYVATAYGTNMAKIQVPLQEKDPSNPGKWRDYADPVTGKKTIVDQPGIYGWGQNGINPSFGAAFVYPDKPGNGSMFIPNLPITELPSDHVAFGKPTTGLIQFGGPNGYPEQQENGQSIFGAVNSTPRPQAVNNGFRGEEARAARDAGQPYDQRAIDFRYNLGKYDQVTFGGLNNTFVDEPKLDANGQPVIGPDGKPVSAYKYTTAPVPLFVYEDKRGGGPLTGSSSYYSNAVLPNNPAFVDFGGPQLPEQRSSSQTQAPQNPGSSGGPESGQISRNPPDLGKFNVNPKPNPLFGTDGNWTGGNFVSPEPGEFGSAPTQATSWTGSNVPGKDPSRIISQNPPGDTSSSLVPNSVPQPKPGEAATPAAPDKLSPYRRYINAWNGFNQAVNTKQEQLNQAVKDKVDSLPAAARIPLQAAGYGAGLLFDPLGTTAKIAAETANRLAETPVGTLFQDKIGTPLAQFSDSMAGKMDAVRQNPEANPVKKAAVASYDRTIGNQALWSAIGGTIDATAGTIGNIYKGATAYTAAALISGAGNIQAFKTAPLKELTPDQAAAYRAVPIVPLGSNMITASVPLPTGGKVTVGGAIGGPFFIPPTALPEPGKAALQYGSNVDSNGNRQNWIFNSAVAGTGMVAGGFNIQPTADPNLGLRRTGFALGPSVAMNVPSVLIGSGGAKDIFDPNRETKKLDPSIVFSAQPGRVGFSDEVYVGPVQTIFGRVRGPVAGNLYGTLEKTPVPIPGTNTQITSPVNVQGDITVPPGVSRMTLFGINTGYNASASVGIAPVLNTVGEAVNNSIIKPVVDAAQGAWRGITTPPPRSNGNPAQEMTIGTNSSQPYEIKVGNRSFYLRPPASNGSPNVSRNGKPGFVPDQDAVDYVTGAQLRDNGIEGFADNIIIPVVPFNPSQTSGAQNYK